MFENGHQVVFLISLLNESNVWSYLATFNILYFKITILLSQLLALTL